MNDDPGALLKDGFYVSCSGCLPGVQNYLTVVITAAIEFVPIAFYAPICATAFSPDDTSVYLRLRNLVKKGHHLWCAYSLPQDKSLSDGDVDKKLCQMFGVGSYSVTQN